MAADGDVGSRWGIWLPTDGQASPSDITQSLAKGARMHGAKIVEGARVTGFEIANGRVVAVQTNLGRIACETVINCGGQWARQIGAMAGVSVPLQAVKHQYVITEKVEGLAADAATLRDPDRRTYFKEEVGGLVFGGYEPNPIAWTQGDVPGDFEFQLFEDDWDHFEQHMTQALARVPALEKTGIKKMINGPESFTPDGTSFSERHQSSATFMSVPVSMPSESPRAAVRAGCWRNGPQGEAPWISGWSTSGAFPTSTRTGRGPATARWKPMASTTPSDSRTKNTRAAVRASSRRCTSV